MEKDKIIFKNFTTESNVRRAPYTHIVSKALPEVSKQFTIADCKKCIAVIYNSFQAKILAKEVTIKKMIQNEQDLLQKIETLEAKWKAAENNSEELKALSNAFRTIGFATSPDLNCEAIEEWFPTHQISLDSVNIDTCIKTVRMLQSISEHYSLHIQKHRSKTEVETRVREISSENNFKAQRQVREETPEFKKYTKFLDGLMKGAKVDKKAAMKMGELMGMKAPAGYEV